MRTRLLNEYEEDGHMIYEVDARGLSCPEPVMLTSAAVKAHPGETIKVLVSEPYSKVNVEKYALSQKKKVTVREAGSEFELLIDRINAPI